MSSVIDLLTSDGRRKKIERAMSVNCHVCRASLDCPQDQDFWVWLESPDVMAFYLDHDHGRPRAVGAEITVLERE